MTDSSPPQPPARRLGQTHNIRDTRALERDAKQVQQLLLQKKFETVEAAKAYLDSLPANGAAPPDQPKTAVQRADDIMQQAFAARGGKRIRLARAALNISPDCADAYVLLAEEAARSLTEARELYQKGMEAGERALGAQAFEAYVGHFWDVIDTRSYMRAREGLAIVLWMLQEEREAMAHYRDLLKLNPNDHQMIRYRLLRAYLDMNEYGAAHDLLSRYPEETSAVWLYTMALLAFRRYGATLTANIELYRAMDYNPFVPPYLLNSDKLPRAGLPITAPGTDEEALNYAIGGFVFWKYNEGALDWLRDVWARRETSNP